MTQKRKHQVLPCFFATGWLINSLVLKILDDVPRRSFIFIFTLASLFSCTKPSDDPVEPQPVSRLEADSSRLTFPGTAGEIDSFHIESSVDWVITIEPAGTSWLKVNMLSGSGNEQVLVNTTDSNHTGQPRTASVIITSTKNPPISIAIEIKQLAFAGPPPPVSNILWTKLFGGMLDDEGLSSLATPDGGQITVGTCRDGGGDLQAVYGAIDAFIMRTDSSGNKLWARVLGSKYSDRLYNIINSSDGGYVAAGVNEGDNHSGTTEQSSAWIIKLDANGNLVWERLFRPRGHSVALSITASPGGGYAFTGTTGGDLWVVKIDELGNDMWQKTVTSPFRETAYSIVANPSGGYFTAGQSAQGTTGISGHHGGSDAQVTSIDESGNLLWSKYIGGTGNEWLWDAKVVSNGLLFGGTSNSNDGDITSNHGTQTSDALVLKMDDRGNIIWLKMLGSQNDEDGNCLAICPDNNNYLLGGTTRTPTSNIGYRDRNDTWVVKLNTEGEEVAQQYFGGSALDMPYSVIAHQDGTFTLTGLTESSNGYLSGNHGMSDVWLLKFKFP